MKTLKAFFLITLTASVCFAGDPPATHGMLVFSTKSVGKGPKKVYASHLPMFHRPHDYQAIFEIRFDSKTLQTYLDDKAKSPDSINTLVPDPFVLTDLAHHPASVKAVLYHGHFEKGGTPITELVTVEFSRTLVFEKLFPVTPHPGTYQGFIFGDEDGLFLAHRITGAPNFDQIVELEPNPKIKIGAEPWMSDFPGVPDTALSAPATLSLPHIGPIQTKGPAYLELDDLKD